MTKSNTLGYVAAFPIPEVIRGINAFTLGAQAVNPEVQVEEGVVFLRGEAETEQYRTWAGDLARRTQDVTAVVNQLEIVEPSVWDFQPVTTRLRWALYSAISAACSGVSS